MSLLRGLSSGDPDQAVRHVSPDRLIQHDPSMAGGVDGLRERAGQPTGELDVASQNALQPAGTVQTGAQTVTLRLTGAFDDLQAVRDTPLAAGGRVIRVGDVAAVRHGTEDPPTFLVRHGGVPVLTLGVVMRDGWNGTRLDRDLAREVRAIHGDLPLGVGFAQVSDQARNIAEAYDEFVVKFVVALAVVMAVSLLALGWRVGVVVAASVPLTLAAVFAIMLATGRQFDRITLGALILALACWWMTRSSPSR